MPTIEEFINHNVGKPSATPKGLIMEAYALGLAHGKGEEDGQVPEEEEMEEVVQEEESEEVEEEGENLLNKDG